MDAWVETQYREAYCNGDDELVASTVNLDLFREDLKSQRPEVVKEVTSAVKRLDRKICSDICRDLPVDDNGRFLDEDHAQQKLQEVREDLKDRKVRRAIVRRIQEDKVAALKLQTKQGKHSTPQNIASATNIPSLTTNGANVPLLEQAATLNSAEELYDWIRSQYMNHAFIATGFIGWKKFRAALIKQRPQLQSQVFLALQHLRLPGHEFSLEDPLRLEQAAKTARRQQGGVKLAQPQSTVLVGDQPASKKTPEPNFGSIASTPPGFTVTAGLSSSAPTAQIELSSPVPPRKVKAELPFAKGADAAELGPFTPKTLTNKLQQVNINGASSVTPVLSGAASATQGTQGTFIPDFTRYSQLLTGKKKSTGTRVKIGGTQRDLEQAPLLSGSIISQHAHDLVPQYGLLGCLAGQDPSKSASQVFLNTNVPLSTFICGVQGSGKSHTTSCILENAVIPSLHLGQLERPVSTLVFSYGEWSSGGAGFNISEATYLATPSKVFPGHQVKRITVLTSPSNLAIKRLYQRHPNVRIIPFRLKAKTLDIGALRTLMAVDEKSSVPLYMAKVESILRSIAAQSKNGSLDYTKFKQVLKLESFDPTQTNMLEMRLNLLESFLDLTDTAPQPDYVPGEITIIDLSDAFISPSTACILFKLGLERFLQCETPGKLVVLDEAHKYMLNTPGSKVLTEYLTKIIRLQRHQGARVVISTQEPTVSTDLIALCSITVIHRFTSPAWYNALKKHINAMDDDQQIMHDIEGLETGEAFVYAPNAVLGKKEDGSLIKATGRLLKLDIRDRVTLDGGESIMAI